MKKSKKALEHLIKQLEARLFAIDMIDTWTNEDRKAYEEISYELSIYKKLLEEREVDE